MSRMRGIHLLNFFLLSMGLISGPIQAQAPNEFGAQCKALQGENFSHVPDALIHVTSTTPVEADAQADVPGYCQVEGYVAPTLGFIARLPLSNWNGKFIQLGCGGWCGTLRHIVGCNDPLRRGYACIVSDGGQGGGVKWAFNNTPGEFEFALRTPHVTALTGKALVERYYSQAPRRSYFMGCSAGGGQAMMAAQRFPWDFDGIIAGAPAIRVVEQFMDRLWDQRAMKNGAGEVIFSKDDLETLNRAVVARCDMNDGIADGLIGDPRACDFDPRKLVCAAGKTAGCLTAQQTEAAQKIYRGPVSSQGVQLIPPAGLPGSEGMWLDWFVGMPASDTYMGDAFRYRMFHPDPGPDWKVDDFDFDRDYKRLGLMAVYQANNPDLSQFKAAGGKLLAYMGWSDVAAGGVVVTTDYYEAVQRLMGGRDATDDFYRLFMVPGMDHCVGGKGAYAIDYLSYLEAWVEKGEAPQKLIGAQLKLDDPKDYAEMARRLRFPLEQARIEFTRPIYPYPTTARYSGRGDPKDAASFRPVEPSGSGKR